MYSFTKTCNKYYTQLRKYVFNERVTMSVLSGVQLVWIQTFTSELEPCTKVKKSNLPNYLPTTEEKMLDSHIFQVYKHYERYKQPDTVFELGSLGLFSMMVIV